MLLLHQTGSVKIGEVIRYTVTYTPSQDRILPSPEFLYLRVKNSSAVALRAAFVHGPYNLSVAAYPATYNPNKKFEEARQYGVPEFEPMLKAGGTWTCHLVVPEAIRQSAGIGYAGKQHFGNGPEHEDESVSWVIEIASQVIFSTSAAVHYDFLLARDEKSLSLSSGSIPVVGNQAQVPQPGRITDHQQSKGAKDGHHAAQSKGVFSRAIHLKVEDTASLWNTPQLPGLEQSANNADAAEGPASQSVQTAKAPKDGEKETPKPKRKKNVHLVILTHGLHSNLGSDMLYLKESIDAAAKQARSDATARRQRERDNQKSESASNGQDTAPNAPKGTSGDAEDEDEDDEEVIVRGFSGNATRTERGIKYLGKRLARYVLSTTHPDQPFLPAGKAAQEVAAHAFKGEAVAPKPTIANRAHKHSTIQKAKSERGNEERGYKIARISFVGHSLGGLVQTYAVAYIQKHSPEFFDLIKPINFITLATPFLGLNHENPMYVKFALDFNLIGRTGQDLGLTWRAPTIARNGWGSLVGNLGENAHKKVMGEPQPESKPLLRILPTGPAHIAFKKFRNRTVYSNVVNDGIVPLRTSCLLFLDWQGLGRVEKARREAGLVETLVGVGWAELTGANVTSPRNGPWTPRTGSDDGQVSGAISPESAEDSHEVPQPPTDAVAEDDRQSLRPVRSNEPRGNEPDYPSTSTTNNNNPFSGFFNFFRGSNDTPKQPAPPTAKQRKIYQRSQTLQFGELNGSGSSQTLQSKVTSGHELGDDASSGMSAPPKTSFFESAGDLLNPKLPSVEFLIDPEMRPRTIFHDRVYHPEDIPPPPLKKRPTGSLAMRRSSFKRSKSSSSLAGESGSSSPYPEPPAHQDSTLSAKDYDDTSHTNPDKEPDEVVDSSNMKVEEKIARAYHRDLSWRKVLVKLEPDAHNNIVCRRMFANAFGWPVIKHLVDAHFSDSATARRRDENEQNKERAKATDQGPEKDGAEIEETTSAEHSLASQTTDGESRRALPQVSKLQGHKRTDSEIREATDSVPDLPSTSRKSSGDTASSSARNHLHDRTASFSWSDGDFADSGEDSDSDDIISAVLSAGSKRPSRDAEKTPERSISPLRGAFWTEKIVGKGASEKRRSKSPSGAAVQEVQSTTTGALATTGAASTTASNATPSELD